MIVTIDGPSGTGKSTIAKKLADRLGWVYFDTGALYRALSWQILSKEAPLTPQALKPILQAFLFSVEKKEHREVYLVNGQDVTREIRTPKVTDIVSKISAMECVRTALLPLQRDIAKKGQIVFEGRDLGTVVFPRADFKFFLTASLEVRAKRRLKDLQTLFPAGKFDYKTVLHTIEKRDSKDSKRELAPLTCAFDAIVLDTSELSIDDVVSILEIQIKKSL